MSVFFISDLHLSPEKPHLGEALFEFIDNKCQTAEALYILGDLFDAWIGDDEDSEYYVNILTQFKKRTDANLNIYFMHGNRDFLIGREFSDKTGISLLKDPTVIEIYGEPMLLMHGDSLCTSDTEYMAFRKQVRNIGWQEQVLSLPLEQRRAMAAQLRQQSKSMNSNKAEDIMDVNPVDVEDAFKAHGVKTLLHGHTHRPACHDLAVDEKQCQRIVLGDWGQLGWYIEASPSGLELIQFNI